MQPVLEALDGAAPACPRLWRRVGRTLVPAFDGAAPAPITLEQGQDLAELDQRRIIRPLTPGGELWVETPRGKGGDAMVALFSLFLRADRETSQLSHELAARYEEIDLLYAINDILGQALRLDQAAHAILRAVSEVVGCARASLAVLDEEAGVLRTVAAQGFDPVRAGVIALDDPHSIAARVVRDCESCVGLAQPAPGDPERGYHGGAYLSVPITYRAPGGASRCVGVINLTDRVADGRFSAIDQKLVTAAANQVGAAIELARLMSRQREQQRIQDELELAHHLQRSLLPIPSVLQGDADVAVHCHQAEQVGGDFYSFNRLGLGLVGVMVGDVSSHGISAAMVMASVMSAAGIHASGLETPDLALTALGGSLANRLAASDTYLTIFYGILDPINHRLTWANAGHPHAFRIPREGSPERLEATAPPLGLAALEIGRRSTPWNPRDDLLCIWTDGLVDAQNQQGERFGEPRLLEALTARRALAPDRIVAEVMAEADAFAPHPDDDRTLLVLHL